MRDSSGWMFPRRELKEKAPPPPVPRLLWEPGRFLFERIERARFLLCHQRPGDQFGSTGSG